MPTTKTKKKTTSPLPVRSSKPLAKAKKAAVKKSAVAKPTPRKKAVAPTAATNLPKFTGHCARALQYALDCISGKRVVGWKVKAAAQRFVDDLHRDAEGWKYTFSEVKAQYFCTIAEAFVHEKGELQGQKVRLEDFQCFIFCNIFGWIDRATRYRRFREALIVIPRGNGKSPMAAWVALYMFRFDNEPGAEVYTAATSKDQAMEVFRPAKAIVDMVPALTRKYGIESNASNLYHPKSRSRLLPVIGRPKDGKAPHCVTNDEYHEQVLNALYDSFKRGMNKRRQSLMFNITTAGDTIEGPCYRMQKSLEAILQREYDNERIFGLVYDAEKSPQQQASSDFWTTREACEMSNPNFGVSINPEAFLDDLAEAIRDSSKQNGFRCKNQNFWAQATTSWMNMAFWDKCARPGIQIADYAEFPCVLGSDLASTLDLSSTIAIFTRPREEDGKPIYTAFCNAYLPKARVYDKSRPHLQAWEKDGFLIATDGNSIDYTKIENDTVKQAETYQTVALCYDARYAGQYAQRVNARTGITLVVVPPSADQLSPAMYELEGAVHDGRFEHDGHPVFRWCMANVLARKNEATGNYHMPGKERPGKKIDCAVALFIGMVHARTLLAQTEQYIEEDDLFWLDDD